MSSELTVGTLLSHKQQGEKAEKIFIYRIDRCMLCVVCGCTGRSVLLGQERMGGAIRDGNRLADRKR